MKLFYVCPDEHLKNIQHEWHALGLGNGHSLVCVRWRDELHETEWSNHPTVLKLPHPIFESAVGLSEDHVRHLSARWIGVKPGHTIHDLLKHATKEDVWMRLHVL